MKADRVLDMARRLVEEENLEGLRLLVRMAALPLQARALFIWAGEDATRDMVDALPLQVARPFRLSRKQGKELWRPVDLKEASAVLSVPWSLERMEKALRTVAPEKWEYDSQNHWCVYYRPLGLVFFQNGVHSGAVAALKREGLVTAWEDDLREYFAMGLRVEVREDRLWAVDVNTENAAPFDRPDYGLLWGLAQVLWEEGVEV